MVYLQRLPEGVIRDWTSRKQGASVHTWTRHIKGFLKKPLQKCWGIAQYEQTPAKNNDRVANRTVSFKRTLL